jgi:hypothetical protein
MIRFQLSQVLPVPDQREKSIFHVLHLAGLAYAADRWNDLRRWIRDQGDTIAAPSVAEVDWDKRLLFRLYDCWLRLLRKNSWDDLDSVREIVAGLREDQKAFEAQLLKAEHPEETTALAIRLVSLYHLAKATELLAVYMLQGEPAGISSRTRPAAAGPYQLASPFRSKNGRGFALVGRTCSEFARDALRE